MIAASSPRSATPPLARRALALAAAALAVLLFTLSLRRAGERAGRAADASTGWRPHMKCSAGCSTLRRVGLVIATLWLAACARVGSDPGSACPPVPEYSAAFQARAAEEVEALQDGAALLTMMQDYAVMREQARACR